MPVSKAVKREFELSTYTELLASAETVADGFQLTIPESWMQGRTTYGGLSAALCLEAALRAYPDLPPLRSANISFIGPAGGAVEGRAQALRQGKSVSFVEADLAGEAGLATRAVFAFGAARESMFDRTFTPPPEMPGPEACEDFIPKGFGPNFAQHFETKLAQGARPGTASDQYDHFIWVRHVDRDAGGPVALLALADMPPPAVMPMFPHFKPISTMSWHMNVLVDGPASADGWWLLQSRAEHARNGYSSQDMLIWNSDLELVVAGRQNVAIFL